MNDMAIAPADARDRQRYVSLMRPTPKGLAELAGESRPQKTERERVAALGGRCSIAFFATLGPYDFVQIFEMPSNEADDAIRAHRKGDGACRAVDPPAFDPPTYGDILGRVVSITTGEPYIRTALLVASATLFLVSAANAGEPGFVTDATVNICTTAAFPPLTFKKDPADIGAGRHRYRHRGGPGQDAVGQDELHRHGVRRPSAECLARSRCGLIVGHLYQRRAAPDL